MLSTITAKKTNARIQKFKIPFTMLLTITAKNQGTLIPFTCHRLSPKRKHAGFYHTKIPTEITVIPIGSIIKRK